MTSSAAGDASSEPAHPSAPDTRLRGRWLLLARVGWVVVAGLSLSLFIGSLPAAFAKSHTFCRTAVCNNDQVVPAAVQHLYALGLSLDFFAWYLLVLKCLLVFVFAAIGLVIFWRAFADRTALVAAFTFVTFPITFNEVPTVLPAAWWLPAQIVNLLGSIGMTLLFYVFPDGRFVPRWTRWIWAGTQLAYVVQVFFPSVPFLVPSSPYLLLGLVVSLGAAQIYRYRRVSTPVERQQTKWVVLGVAVGFGGSVITSALNISFPDFSSKNPLLYLISAGLAFLFTLLIPLSFGLALLHYRLWDVDVLINKVLVYGVLTGLLGALYAGLILGLESLAGLVGGQVASNPVVLVISTLAIAALFLPVRRRIQALIDRRFYRRKYDAEQVLATFSSTLRTKTELEQVRGHLLAVVNETMQPAHVSLWLRQPEPSPRELTYRWEQPGQPHNQTGEN